MKPLECSRLNARNRVQAGEENLVENLVLNINRSLWCAACTLLQPRCRLVDIAGVTGMSGMDGPLKAQVPCLC